MQKTTLREIQVRLTEAIRTSKMTQKELGEKLGVCQQTVSAYLNSTKMPALDTLSNLCKILDLDANYILCVED